MTMKRSVMMRFVVGLIAIACMMCMLTACGGKDDHHTCTYGANVTETLSTSAKCTETYHICTVCEKKEVVSATKHSYDVTDPQVVYKGEEATGYKQTYTCKICKYQYSRMLKDDEIKDAGLPSIEELNAKHVWTQTESEATKAEYEAFIGKTDDVPVDTGYVATYWKTVRSCSHCNETETVVQRRDVKVDTGDGDSTTPTIPDENEGDKNCKHTYETKTVAPTCTAKGYTQYTCSKCKDSYTSDYTTALGHKWSNWNTKAATCTSNGSKTRSCANCGKTESETIKATGHSYGSWSTTKKATCDSNGTKSAKCSACGHTKTETIAATGHSWDEGKVTTKPTSCSDMGVKTYTCKTCGKTKTEQIKGNHTYGEWKWEEYTFKHSSGGTYTSHRKYRTCTKCGFKEVSGSDHICQKGSDNHTVTTVKAGTCTTKATMRSTCKVCGWYVEYEGSKGKHTIKTETRHLTDYGTYTNELDAVVSECTSCGTKEVTYTYGQGFSDYNRYRNTVVLNQGSAFASRSPSGADFLAHPTWQTVIRDYKYDSEGYVKQFTVYWHDASGNRYSYVVDCTPEHLASWFAEYGLTGGSGYKYQLKISGNKVVPYKVSWTG